MIEDAALGPVFGVLVTYRRPDGLARALTAIADQTLRVRRLVVVDNAGPDPRTEAAVDDVRRRGLEVDLISTGANVGPAGGRAIGMDVVLSRASADDWIALFDDDDAMPEPGTLGALVRFAEERRAAVGRLGGVGLRGARFDRARVRTVAVPDRELALGPVHVDHLHGGFFPIYAVAAAREVGTFRRDLFYGFEELEYGLRMTAAGFALVVDGALWRTYEEHFVRYTQRPDPRLSLDEPRWARYYALRNLLRIAIDHGDGIPAARVALIRGIGKPIANLPFRPRVAFAHLQLGSMAIRDAWSGHLGAIPGADPGDVAFGWTP